MTEPMDEDSISAADPFKELAPISGTPVAPAHGIAAIALSMAMKYHDINMVKDGALYQQYKLEGKNFRPFTIDEAFETAMRIEAWLLGASDRIASIVIDCVKEAVIEAEDDEEPSDPEDGAASTGGSNGPV